MNRPRDPFFWEDVGSRAITIVALAIAVSFALCHCGGEAFTAAAGDAGALAGDGGAGDPGRLYLEPTWGLDAGDAGDAGHSELDQVDAGDAGDAGHRVLDQVDAGDVVVDVRIPDAGAVDAGDVVDAVLEDVSRSDTGPAPALCCETPCSGAQVAAIVCGNGPAWTCDPSGAACSSSSCAPGDACHWMGVCTGRVAVCP